MPLDTVQIGIKDALAIVGGIAAATAGLTWFVSAQFSQTRKLIHELCEGLGRRVTRIEMYLIRNTDYQPGADPVEELERSRRARRNGR